ncbi:MAG: cytochrome [Acidimicrobiales bacterium]|nr:cytochrome [Acidimicrobiales bacterium]
MASTRDDLSLDDIHLLEDTWAEAVPYDQFALLRKEAPVFWHEHPEWKGFWAVTRYDDVRAVSRDHQTFSAELGSTFLQDHDEAQLELIRMTILNMDPPKHSRYRRLVSAGFKPRMITALLDHIQELADRIVAEVDGEDEIEFVERVAAELPLQVICELLGVPNDDRHLIFDWSNRMVGSQDPDFRVSDEDGEAAMGEIYMYCDALANDRRVNPQDDIMTALVEAEVDGDRLTQEELNMFFVTLVVAGNETTRNLISHSVLAILEHPELKAELVAGIDDDELWTTAVEEFLRWGASIHNFRRTATVDTEIAGQPIKAGDKVVIYYPAANRDPEHFENPDVFDPRRTPNDHVTFGGGGTHFCLGANLARSQIKAMVRTFLRRYPDVAPAGPHRRMRSDFVNGIKYLPVRLAG